MSSWFGWMLDLFTFTLVVYLSIPGHYYLLWCKLLQHKEPFTRWFSRIAEAHPLFWWGGVGTLVLLSLAACLFGVPWLRVYGLMWTGFFCWFCPHILDYVSAHQNDNPPSKLLFWRKVNYGKL